jgi:hypothetical protein
MDGLSDESQLSGDLLLDLRKTKRRELLTLSTRALSQAHDESASSHALMRAQFEQLFRHGE